MASLFGKHRIRELAERINTEDVQEYIDLVKTWHEDYHKGSLKGDKETSREQAYNQDFFIKILGYKEKPANPHSLEPKATTDSGQLPDAVLSYTDTEQDIKNIAAVVELKGASIDLDRPQRREGNFSPVQQGFKYKAQYRNCPFVVVSNFWEFRLYRDNLLDYEVWTLDDLVNPADDYLLFKTWYVLLTFENFAAASGTSKTEDLLSDIRVEQEEIGKKFYKVYREARLDLLRDIYRNNQEVRNNIDLGIEKAQKIIDRVVFSCFAEDKGLLPENTLQRVLKAAEGSTFGGSLWNTLKGFFEAIDVGSDKLDIPQGYNGGLFRHDPELNNLKISDEPLRTVLSLGTYNFEDDLSVTILGHIFEQSISDLEEIKNKVNEQQDLETIVQSRRKKDGIFYTPDYIVRYIVENSLGTYLREHEEKFKEEFRLKGDINDVNYEKREQQAYEKYQQFLENVKVLDPACGSGAFLVYVFDYLMAENKRVASIRGTLFNTDQYIRSILKNNIFGVDLNEESVEITKLSLWLKSAEKGKQLTTLNKNIRCGNSLISDPEVAGDKAFDWNKGFPEIMKTGGFDVLVGNPPYVQLSKVSATTDAEKDYLIERYETSGGRLNTFIFFIHLSNELLRDGGFVSYIIPNTILTQDYYKATRHLLVNSFALNQVVTYEKLPFSDAIVENITFVASKKDCGDVDVFAQDADGVEKLTSIPCSIIQNSDNYLIDIRNDEVCRKIDSNNFALLNALVNINQGIALKGDKSLSVKNEYKTGYYKLLDGKNINKYSINWTGEYLDYNLERIHSCKRKDIFEQPKLMFRRVSANLIFTYDDEDYFALNTLVIITPKEDIDLKALLGVLNSPVVNYYYVNKYKSTKKVFSEIQARSVGQIPIPSLQQHEKELASFVDKILNKTKELNKNSNRFREVVSEEYSLDKWSPKLNKWWKLDFDEFVKTLKVDISINKKDELAQFFDKQKVTCFQIQQEIDDLDSEVNEIVYKLYGLSADEVAKVESK